MGTVSTTLPSDGQTIDASDVNTPINAILSEFNGNIDDNNIKTGANINGAKIASASLPGSAFDSTIAGGWLTGALPAVSSVTANGNRSYDITFASTVASTLSSGMRLRTTRTVAAPTQCTSLNGTTQYYSKTSPNKLTFTDDFVVSAWVKASSYSNGIIASRSDGTNGWYLQCDSGGRIALVGTNASPSNYSLVQTYQSIPLNKWVHVAAQLDMSTFTATTTTSYVMIDGVNVPAIVTRAGTNPTTIAQTGNLEIGAWNGLTNPFAGKIAQVAIYNAKVTQATILASINQGLSGSETSLASAYSFNAVITDLNTTTPNDLTANGSAVATNADSPFGNAGTSSTLDYALVQAVNAAVVTVSLPEGCTIPTSGGVTSVAYSTQANPYGWISDKGRWAVETYFGAALAVGGVSSTWYTGPTAGSGAYALSIPVGDWHGGYVGSIYADLAGAANSTRITCISTNATTPTTADIIWYSKAQAGTLTANSYHVSEHFRNNYLSLTAATSYYLHMNYSGTTTNISWSGNGSIPTRILFTPSNL